MFPPGRGFLTETWQRSIYSPFSSGIKVLTYCLSSSICPDVARSLDEDFDSSHSSAAFGLSFLSSRGRYGGLAVGFKLTFSSIYCKNEVFEGEGTALIHF